MFTLDVSILASGAVWVFLGQAWPNTKAVQKIRRAAGPPKELLLGRHVSPSQSIGNMLTAVLILGESALKLKSHEEVKDRHRASRGCV